MDINSHTLLFLVLFACISLTSCNEDDEYSVVNNITGEWFGTYSDNDQITMTTVEFSNDGTYREWVAYVAKESAFNHLRKGSYSNGEKIDIVYSTVYNPKQIHQVWRIVKADKYMLSIYDETNLGQQTYRKIVDTYDLNAGERKFFSINDPDFNAVSFSSCDESIATIDGNGEILAVKRGVTFIRVISATGEVVVRVNVIDKENVVDDYSKYLNSPLSNVIKDFGELYQESTSQNGRKHLTYNVIDDILKRLHFDYILEDKVYRIEGELHDNIDLSTIISDFDTKYSKLDSDNASIHDYYFVRKEDGYYNQYIGIRINEELRFIIFEYIPNGYEEFDGMIQLNIDDFAAWYHFDLTDKYSEGLLSLPIVNEIYDNVVVEYDETTRIIKSIYLTCVPGQNALLWLFAHYTPFDIPDIGIVYAKTNNFMMADYYVKIIYSEELGTDIVAYISHKITSI